MISYEKAVQLKSAGFPQPKDGPVEKFGMAYVNQYTVVQLIPPMAFHGHLFTYIPTVPEMIQECGDGFSALNRTEQGNFFCDSPIDQEEDLLGLHDTPDEAVADLYLQLNPIIKNS